MNNEDSRISVLVNLHLRALNKKAELVMLSLHIKPVQDDMQIFVLTPEKLDFHLEQQYQDAKYKLELQSGKSISVYIYHQHDWHQQFANTPIYKKVQEEGIRIY
ncbi:hypothetical protein [Carboxylicivirga marina]|uniref:Uncharacterized protein n=1 Tax=Carboxylicivirga marina TaxID=2800988 RepID=A0ABS1HKW4_9BACT|nr:hypothetical protein [Carboxylicivirga marina]MBK3518251.1 hypothetical protein [Carboxylicivirga marina]